MKSGYPKIPVAMIKEAFHCAIVPSENSGNEHLKLIGEHTPGPWYWDSGIIPPDGPGRYATIYTEGGEKIIAEFNEFHELNCAEGLANARLISAAPDLLAALQSMIAPGRGPSYNDWSCARAAIAKAKGTE